MDMFFLMNKTKDQISWVSSHDLYWENKMYKRKRSIELQLRRLSFKNVYRTLALEAFKTESLTTY